MVIQTDDQTLHQLYATFVNPNGVRARVMPNTLDLIGGHGINFTRYYASYPLCCPSRTTLLTGQYAHSHGVIGNAAPNGGWPGFKARPAYNHNLATWLQDAGYRTIHIGRFLNAYGGTDGPDSPETVVPPGWDDWETDATYNSGLLYYGYTLNVNGAIEGPFGNRDYAAFADKDPIGCDAAALPDVPCNNSTDAFTQRAVAQIQGSAPGRPFYLQVDYNAPHGDIVPPIGPEPAPRHYDTTLNTPVPRPPGFNEGDISDKPSFIRDKADPLTAQNVNVIRRDYRKSIESLRSVDDGVKRMVDALRSAGELRNTYVFFISDNGFFFGEHRLERAKLLPYEPAAHLPLLVRGPGIRAHSRSNELTANVDLTPTIVRLAKAEADRPFDGRSLRPYWTKPTLRTRRPILLESFADATNIDGEGDPDRSSRVGPSDRIAAPTENYLGVLVGPYKYIEYQTGDAELYDLSRDPNETNNRVTDPRFDRVQRILRIQLNRLEGCLGPKCKFVSRRLPKPGSRR